MAIPVRSEVRLRGRAAERARQLQSFGWMREESEGPSKPVQAYGGAESNRIAPQATAFPRRGSSFSMQYLTRWSGWPDEKQGLDWTRHFYDEMRPYVSGSAYSNMCDLDLIDWEHATDKLRALVLQVAIRRQPVSALRRRPNGLSNKPTAIPAPPTTLWLCSSWPCFARRSVIESLRAA